MAKRSEESIDEDKIKVMNLLEQDSHKSIDEIAKSCGFSRQKVWRIIKNLEEKKIIWGYTAVTEEKEKNLKHFTALVKKSNVPFDDKVKKEIITDKVDNYPEGLVVIENIYFTHGICDLIFTFYASDLRIAKQFLNHSFYRQKEYIKEYTLIETIFPIRKQGLKNPKIKELTEYI